MLLRLSHSAGFDDVSTGTKRGWIEITNKLIDPLTENSPLLIIHHPSARPLSVSINTESIIKLDNENKRLQYLTDTEPGSAGAPCFNMNLQIIAMHLGRTKLPHSSGERFGNEGVLISKIVEDIKNKGLSELVSQKPSYELKTSNTIAPVKGNHSHDGLDEEFENYIMNGEGQRVEFKETACLNFYNNKKDVNIQAKIVETVASFMNSKEGGVLFIGVDDNGKVVGIEREYSAVNPQKANWDGYLLFINDLLRNGLEAKTTYGLYKIHKHINSSLVVCYIIVNPSDGPVFFNKKFFIRDIAQTRKLEGLDAHEYMKKRWPDIH
jgi:hypothetical protein